jgi:hypothetical protein
MSLLCLEVCGGPLLELLLEIALNPRDGDGCPDTGPEER